MKGDFTMEYKLNGKISLKDYIQFNKNHKKHGAALIIRLTVYPMLIIFVAVSLFPNLDFFKYYIFNLSPLELLKIFYPFIFLVIFLILLNIIIMPFIYKRHYNANKSLQYPFNITINDQFISITSENGSDKLTKENINKIYYDKDSIYIYIGLNIGRIIKKRFLENENDFGELVKFIKENYGK
jgi:hypothetical protein